MQIYTVHERPGGAPDNPDVVLVKEGFCWPALFVPLLWGLYHRLWLGLLAYLAGLALVGGLGAALGLGEPAQGLLGLVYALLVAASANDWRRWTLKRRGYRMTGVVAGNRLEEAERRLFGRWSFDPAPSAGEAAAP